LRIIGFMMLFCLTGCTRDEVMNSISGSLREQCRFSSNCKVTDPY